MSEHHWMEDAERVYLGNYIGECDHGRLWVEVAPVWWWTVGWRRFSRWNLRHLWIYWRSRRAGRVVWLETIR